MLLYLPLADAELTAYAGQLNAHRATLGLGERNAVIAHGAGRPLAGVGAGEILYVVAHGRETTNNEIAGVVRGFFGGRTQKNMTAAALARQMQADGLAPRFADLRLLVCWAGMARVRGGSTQVPFAGQLCGALKGRGYGRVMVTGFNGSVAMQPTRNVVIEPGEADTPTPAYMAMYADQGQLPWAGPLRSTGDHGQSMAEIVAARDPLTLASRSTWY